MTAKIIVAFKTRLVRELMPTADQFDPPATYKNEDAIAKWRANLARDMELECLQQPYTATFDEVRIADPANSRFATWTYRAPDSGKQPVSLAIRSWILSKYKSAWPNIIHNRVVPPEAVIVGFNPRLFLKILGTECSLPCNRPAEDNGSSLHLPLSMWYGNSDHRDIAEAVMPAGYKLITWPMVLKARGLAERFPGWSEPGTNVEQDLELALELSAQLGMLDPAV